MRQKIRLTFDQFAIKHTIYTLLSLFMQNMQSQSTQYVQSV